MQRYLLAVLCVASITNVVFADECNLFWDQTTDDFYFEATSDQGVPGDVVAVDLSLQVDKLQENYQLFAVGLTICYDSTLAELLDPPQYSTAWDELFYASYSYSLRSDSGEPKGFSVSGDLRREAVSKYFPTTEPLYLGTVFFRLKGAPGSSFQVMACDVRVPKGGCFRAVLAYYRDTDADPSLAPSLSARSTRHRPATIRIVEGEVTRPDPPALPPQAKVYSEAPTAETASIEYALGGAVASPGAKEVPLPLYITSNFEWSGYAVSMFFPPGDLELARVEEPTRPGAVLIDNTAGHLVMYMDNSHRRLGAEGERVKIATLYFNLKDGAGSSGPIECKFQNTDRDALGRTYLNWLAIQYKDGTNPEALPVTSKVDPVVLALGLINVQTHPTTLGDVNLDYAVNISDPVSLLGFLFQGEEITCLAAADFNQDQRVNISDPIAILGSLFLGTSALPKTEVDCTSP